MPFPRHYFYTFLTAAPPEVIPDPNARAVHRLLSVINPTDAPILVAAIESGADCLVTGNSRHFTPAVATSVGFPIFSPAEYVARLA
ncbi:MAG: hypothetical protein EPO21_01925 [Chloroflexota bacterium]|nr:MAG: hypothetical protein EPO21_01925 [Chloroflexota bacterium]